MKKYEHATIKKLPLSEIEITGSISGTTFDSFRAKALKNINEAIEIDGFRKGNIPEKTLVAKVGEKTILEEMAELALSEAYPSIVMDHKIDALGRPDIQITKMALGNPLEFIIKTAVAPEITLGDYKKIAREIPERDKKELEVSEKDISEAIDRIRTSHASHEGHDHEKMTKDEHDAAIKASMPEITDEFVAGLGDFKNVEDFKIKIKTALVEDKKREAREKRRIEMAEKISDASSVELPLVLIESEMRRIELQFEDDIKRMGVTLDDYLKHAKKTVDDLKKEWKPHAEKKAKLQMVINKIADAEKINADAKEIEAEVAHILAHYKDADRERAQAYATGVLTNEKVFQFLEEQK